MPPTVPWTEVREHSSPSSCWLVIRGYVYDVTSYLDLHPAGPELILMFGGADATDAFVMSHGEEVVACFSGTELGPEPYGITLVGAVAGEAGGR